MLRHPIPKRLGCIFPISIVFTGNSDYGVNIHVITRRSLLPECQTKYLANRPIIKRKLEQLYYTGSESEIRQRNK